jgi:hypothetical protein
MFLFTAPRLRDATRCPARLARLTWRPLPTAPFAQALLWVVQPQHVAVTLRGLAGRLGLSDAEAEALLVRVPPIVTCEERLLNMSVGGEGPGLVPGSMRAGRRSFWGVFAGSAGRVRFVAVGLVGTDGATGAERGCRECGGGGGAYSHTYAGCAPCPRRERLVWRARGGAAGAADAQPGPGCGAHGCGSGSYVMRTFSPDSFSDERKRCCAAVCCLLYHCCAAGRFFPSP